MDVTIATFYAPFGWTAVIWFQQRVTRLTFGHPSAAAAVKAAGYVGRAISRSSLHRDQIALLEQLTAYGAGQVPDFSGVQVDFGASTPFARHVLRRCREIPWGQTVTYGELARRCGRPGAARAVGNVMARNRVPLVIPCHRVVGAGGRLGGFSAPTGLSMKRRLLALESAQPMTV